MPLTESTRFTNKKLQPYTPVRALRATVRIAPNKTLARGTLLALIAASSSVQTITGNTNITSGTYQISVFGQLTAP